MTEMRKARLIVHRDVGPDFAHHESTECPCEPHVIDPDEPRSTEQINDGIDRVERKH